VVRRLVWLKTRLLWNGLKRDVQRRVGFPLIIALVGLVSANVSSLYRTSIAGLRPEAAAEFALWGAFSFWIVWIALPVFVFPLDENLDPQQFALAPARPRSLIAGLGVSGLVAPSAVLLFVVIGTNIAVFSEQWPMAILSGLLMMTLMIISGQLFTTLVSSMFKTRIGRNLTVFVVLAIAVIWIGSYQIARDAIFAHGLGSAVTIHPASQLSFIAPPVAVQRIITSSIDGMGWDTWGWVALSIAWIGLFAWLWHRILRWILTTPTQGTSLAAEARGQGLAAGRWHPALVLARKELRFFLRDPRQRMVWTGAVIFLGLGAAQAFVGSTGIGLFRDRVWLPLMAPVLVMFIGLPIALNLFGWERNAASYLFVLPVSGRNIIIGKNLATASAIMAESIILALILSALSGSWSVMTLLPALTIGAIACQMAIGNLVSVLAPQRLPREGTDVFSQATEQGCLAIGAQLVSFFAIGLLMVIPASVAVLTVIYEVIPGWFTSIFALIWGILFYSISLAISTRLLRRRIPEVVAWVQVV